MKLLSKTGIFVAGAGTVPCHEFPSRLDRYMMAAVRSKQEQFASVLGSKLKGETFLGDPSGQSSVAGCDDDLGGVRSRKDA